jgi:hypothetical protein
MYERISRCESTIEHDETYRISHSLDIFARYSTRGDSHSLLSATSSSIMEFSALDALASVSACVRDRLSDVEYKISEIRQPSQGLLRDCLDCSPSSPELAEPRVSRG